MPVWKCIECGAVAEDRCKPGKCKNCTATKEKLVKDETESKK